MKRATPFVFYDYARKCFKILVLMHGEVIGYSAKNSNKIVVLILPMDFHLFCDYIPTKCHVKHKLIPMQKLSEQESVARGEGVN